MKRLILALVLGPIAVPIIITAYFLAITAHSSLGEAITETFFPNLIFAYIHIFIFGSPLFLLAMRRKMLTEKYACAIGLILGIAAFPFWYGLPLLKPSMLTPSLVYTLAATFSFWLLGYIVSTLVIFKILSTPKKER